MQRLCLILFLVVAGTFPARALTSLTFAQFSKLNYEDLNPYIDDYFKRYPEQQGCEKIVRNFFQANPPNSLMPYLEEKAPNFYKGIKTKAEAVEAGQKKSNYSLDDFLKLPEAEHRAIANEVGPYLHALLTDENSKAGILTLVRKENRALEVAYMLVQMRAQQTTAQVFSEDLVKIMGGLAQIKQAADRVN